MPLEVIDVKGVAKLAEIRFVSIGPIVISLNLNVIAFPKHSLPTSQNIAARKSRVGVDNLFARRDVGGGRYAFAGRFVIQVALYRETISLVRIPIHAESGLARLPGVEVAAVRVIFGCSIESHSVYSVAEIVAASSETRVCKALFFV